MLFRISIIQADLWIMLFSSFLVSGKPAAALSAQTTDAWRGTK